jgi:hypothetical protein
VQRDDGATPLHLAVTFPHAKTRMGMVRCCNLI